MGVMVRGVKNAFRNKLRTSAVVLILALSIGLSLSMLVASQAVGSRITTLKTEVDRNITVFPAGGRGVEGGGAPLELVDLDKISKLAHVDNVGAFIQLTLSTEGQNLPDGGKSGAIGKTNLESSTDPGTLGLRASGTDSAEPGPTFKLPVRGVGLRGDLDQNGKQLAIVEGRLLNAEDEYSAVLGKALAEKNNLHTGSTFTAYEKTFTVVGIVDQGTKFVNDMLFVPLVVAQRHVELPEEITSIIVQADTIENLERVTEDIKQTLGSDRVDIIASQENIHQALESLESVQSISLIGFVASMGVAGVTIFMIMFVTVRERRREIGVLKAIGGSNGSIVSQFIVEAVVLITIGSAIGLGVTFASSGAIAGALVRSETSQSQQADSDSFRSADKPIDSSNGTAQGTAELIGTVATSVGTITLAYAFIGVLVVAIIGSALPAWFISKIRPAEVLRGE